MRRVLLGAFLFLAACGGGLKNDSGAVGPSDKDLRAQLLGTVAAQQAIADIARTADPDALESCINLYVDDFDGPSVNEGPVSKPSVAQLQAFLVQCLAGHIPHDVRAAPARGVDMRGDNAGDPRTYADR
jgi:hypothetical protein